MSHLHLFRLTVARWIVLLLGMVLLFSIASSSRNAAAAADAGPGGPILLITSPSSTYGAYYAEILRNEGLNEFNVSDASAIDPATLANYDVVVLAKMPLTAAQVTILSNWVNGGGRLVAMAPDAQLAGLLGLTATGNTLSNGYLLVDTSASPGNGIVAQTLQFHGTADLYALNGARRIATLYGDAVTPTSNPAVTLALAGSGKAAAFAYDLATSVVLTRQGNPAWAAQERDGFVPIRSDDKFFGNATGDVKPDWVDPNKIAIPQADEQQRLFANLILELNREKKPLPRFWYFPNGKKAVVVMTGDDHGNGGTAPRFDQFKAASPANCSVANWECVRGTSYIYPNTPLTDAQVAAYATDGFEVGVHINTGCSDYTAASLEATYVDQISQWQTAFPSLAAPITERHHCIVWSDWTSGAVVQRNHGIRLDTSYYYWPPTWANNVPGVFTGSAMPMRFSALDGTVLDVYQAASQMTDESGQTYPFTINTLLDRALGTEGYYGAYTINAHTDVASSPEADAVVASAQARGVPIVSARQMLTWLDARNASSFGSITWSGSALNFNISAAIGANGLQAMLPVSSNAGVLLSITRAGNPVSFTVLGVKGVDYAFFPGDAGSYVASYAPDTGTPTVIATAPGNGATNVPVNTVVTATFGKAMTAATLNASTVYLRTAANALVPASIAYDSASHKAVITPSVPLAASTTYIATVHGGAADPRVKDASGNPLTADVSWSFTTGAAAGCPCGGWTAATLPANASVNDPGPVELGVKLRADQNGYITGIRFYKGGSNTGTHIGNLWTSTGQQLATATFTAESASGWQQVDFASPVAITANTVYVASYFAPTGGYAADSAYFAGAGVDNTPIHMLRDGESGGNGVYAYGSASSFPSQTYNATNYWVDVAFTSTAAPDTSPPTVTSTGPANGATGVVTSSAVTATFSEAMDSSTIASAFQLRNASNAVVAASVSYDASTRVATLTPSAALAASSTYSATVLGGAADPRVKDLAGNAAAGSTTWSFTTAGTVATCASSSSNPIVAENCQPGNAASEWDVNGAGDASIQGFATQISVNKGATVAFKVKTSAASYRIDIYRLGYYSGLGARKVASVVPTASLPQSQPNCLTDSTTGLIDCGNWAISASWATPATAVSGIYIARLVRTDTGGASHMVFIVRDDARSSDVLFQTSDTTWQAYNEWGGNSLYVGGPATNPNRAYKVSYNRPFTTRATSNAVGGPQDWLFNAEYPMVRFLESNGYDVSYQSGVDTDRSGALLLNHRAFLSVGHDEYWSGAQRANVEAARNAGIHLAFFSGNEVFWKTRWENSVDGSGTPYRTLVSYKETHANAKIDPTAAWTGTWMDPRFSPPADGGRPQNALTGTLFQVNAGTTSISVPAADGKMRLWRNTSIASLAAGAVASLPNGVLGYEWDADVDNGFRPPGLVRMSSTTSTSSATVLLDYGSNYGTGVVTHALTLYRHSSGAKVFGAGTVQWAWGLDSNHDLAGTVTDLRMQQATVNLLADMNVQPALLQAGLTAATASADTTAPTSTITSPTAGATPQQGIATTVSGSASDTGGNVGGVEISTDGGATWHPTTGRGSWTYSWTPATTGNAILKTRAVDDSGNLENPGAGVAVVVQPRACPCSIWSSSAVPSQPADPDTGSVNVGVKFSSDQNGFITALRFYKGAGNTGTHVGALWTSGGQQLAIATFTSETATGWQQVNLATPVAITANTVYVVSYLAPAGHYAGDGGYFLTSGVDSPPLHALRDGTSGANGVYVYGSTTAFPNSTYQSANYWVDVVFSASAPADTTAPTVTATTPASGATGVAPTTALTATFSEAMALASISTSSIELRNAANALVTTTVSYNGTTNTATIQPGQALAAGTYTATVKGGATAPRVTDVAGNALAANRTWSFTVAGDTTPPTVTAISPAGGATGVVATTAVTATFSEAMASSSISASTIELRSAANVLVPATVSYNATTRVATLQPATPLVRATTYTLTVRGGATAPTVTDLAGNSLAANRTASFTVDATAPTVSAISPASGASLVSRSASVTATFSEAMDASTINGTTFQLRNASNVLVAAVVTYNATTRVATLKPSSSLGSFAAYTVTIVGGAADPRVKDVSGNPMAASRTWSFRTTL